MEIRLPYGRGTVPLNIKRDKIAGILQSRLADQTAPVPAGVLVKRAVNQPVAGPDLSTLAQNRKKVVIITSDHTRPLPSRETLPPLLEAVRRGNPTAEITILIATGFHRPPTPRELENSLGQEICREENIVVHRAEEKKQLVPLGPLPSGQVLEINRLAVEADLLLAEGFIEPHFFAGFSGGGKSVLPGIAGASSILGNHCARFIAHPRARAGQIQGNPVQEDIQAGASLAGLEFISNVALNSRKEVVVAFAGEFQSAHREGCSFVAEHSRAKACPASTVITTNGGYPLDQNIYQAVKGMSAAEKTCKKGGTIIALARCADGHGSEDFYRALRESSSPAVLWEEICRRPDGNTRPDQWEAQILARILKEFRVIMVSGAPREMVNNMHMEWAFSLEEALDLVEKEDRITIIPDGVGVIIDGTDQRVPGGS